MSRKMSIVRISFERLKEFLNIRDEININSIIFTHKDSINRCIRLVLEGEVFNEVRELEEPAYCEYDIIRNEDKFYHVKEAIKILEKIYSKKDKK